MVCLIGIRAGEEKVEWNKYSTQHLKLNQENVGFRVNWKVERGEGEWLARCCGVGAKCECYE